MKITQKHREEDDFEYKKEEPTTNTYNNNIIIDDENMQMNNSINNDLQDEYVNEKEVDDPKEQLSVDTESDDTDLIYLTVGYPTRWSGLLPHGLMYKQLNKKAPFSDATPTARGFTFIKSEMITLQYAKL